MPWPGWSNPATPIFGQHNRSVLVLADVATTPRQAAAATTSAPAPAATETTTSTTAASAAAASAAAASTAAASAAAAASATTTTASATASDKLDVGSNRPVVFLVENVECGQADVPDFFLAEGEFVSRCGLLLR
jgi:hypothetical protein